MTNYASAAEGQATVVVINAILASLRNNAHYDLFWQKVTAMAKGNNVEDPRLLRNRKRPIRYEDSNAAAEFHSTPKYNYCRIYYEALDLIVQSINDKFEQPGCKVYKGLEDLVLKAANKAGSSKEPVLVADMYDNDLDGSTLQMQLQILGANTPERLLRSLMSGHIFNILPLLKDSYLVKVTTIFDVRSYLQYITTAERFLLSHVVLLMKLILIMPGKNATRKRSFSALYRIKTYLRSTMKQECLNSLTILHVHKYLNDALDLSQVASEFVEETDS